MHAVYSSRNVNVAFDGVPIEGLAEDTFIKLQRSEDITDEEVGADGKLSISKLPNRTGTIEVTLQQQSPSNHFFAELLREQDIVNGILQGDLTITDPSGSILSNTRNCHIKTAPEVMLGSTATGQTRTWTFFAEEVDFTSLPSGTEENDTTIRISAQVGQVSGGITINI